MAKRTTGKPATAGKPMTDDSKNILAGLGYVLWPVAVVILIIEEANDKTRDKWLRHHAYNAIGFWIGALIIGIPIWLLAWLPVLGGILVMLYWIAVIVLAIIYGLRAYNRNDVVIPYTTEFLKRNVKGF